MFQHLKGKMHINVLFGKVIKKSKIRWKIKIRNLFFWYFDTCFFGRLKKFAYYNKVTGCLSVML